MSPNDNKNISILGSCVSRDIFSVIGNEHLVNFYRARHSLHTYFEKPLKENLIPDVSFISSSWQKRQVLQEFGENDKVEYGATLLIDFIDERFEKVIYEGRLINLSKEVNSILAPDKFHRAFNRGSPEDIASWKRACKKFSEYAEVLGLNIILHKARFATHDKNFYE